MVGVVCLVAFMDVAWARDNHRLSTREAPSDEDRGRCTQRHGQFLGVNIAVIPHAHSQGHDHWKLGSGKERAPVARCAQSIGCLSEARFANHNTVRYVFGHFLTAFCSTIRPVYHQDIPSSLQARRVGDSKAGPPHPPGLLWTSFL